MKGKIQEEAVLKQETKNDIQELFDELFVGELCQKLANVLSKTTDSIDALNEIKKQLTDNNIAVSDDIGSLKESLKCVGSVDDWGEETLVSFLNQLAKILFECKQEIDKHTAFWGDTEGDVTLFNQIKDLKEKMDDLQKLVQGFENQVVKNEFRKVFEDLKQIDCVINILQTIDEDLKAVKLGLGEEGLAKKVSTSQQFIYEEVSKNRGCLAEIDKKIDDMVFAGKQKFTYVTVGMGVLVISNIVMLVMLLVR